MNLRADSLFDFANAGRHGVNSSLCHSAAGSWYSVGPAVLREPSSRGGMPHHRPRRRCCVQNSGSFDGRSWANGGGSGSTWPS